MLQALLVCAVTAAAAETLPANRWVALPDAGGVRAYAAPIYVPTRKQVMHWAVGDKAMRAFDADAGRWVTDHGADGGDTGPHTLIADATGRLNWKARGYFTRYGQVMHAGVWDSKRRRLVYSLRYIMLAYDPATKTWSDLKAKTVIAGRTFPGGPPAYGAGACYDPVNDEIVMTPHWCAPMRFGGVKNTERVAIDGRVSNHFGTLIYTPADHTWRRPANRFGSAEIRAKRKTALREIAAVSRELDALHAARRTPDEDAAAVTQRIAAAAEKWRDLDTQLDSALRVEPPPRCGAPMVYHEALKSIVLFGGRDGLVRTDLGLHTGPRARNDTWVYDCATQQWRELETTRRPPGKDRPAFFYDPTSALCLLVDFQEGNRRRKTKPKVRLWTLDVRAGAWSLRDEREWTGGLPMSSGRGSGGPKSRTPLYEVAYDPARQVVLMMDGKTTRAFRVDLSALPAKPAPEWTPPKAIVPQTIPPDDPAWVEKLKNLPANTWTATGNGTAGRGWGNAACDPVRGHVYYFGGGHASYQVNDVAIYAVGANQWCFAAGDQNDSIPPTNWGGIAMGYRGGKPAHHQRNQYVAVDGRMFVGFPNVAPPPPAGEDAQPRAAVPHAWFYDLDRGGIWRWRRPDERRADEKAVNDIAVHVTTADGRVLGLMGQNNIARMARIYRNRSGFCSYNIYTNTLTLRDVPPPFPNKVPESRPLCYVSDRDQIFFQQTPRTWVFDVKSATFKDLKPERQPPPGAVRVAEYIDGQDAVLAVITNRAKGKRAEHWVYSFKKNTWTPMTYANKPPGVSSPYGQLVYVAKYGVFVNLPGVQVMRPDVDAVKSP